MGAGRKPHTSTNPATGTWLASYTLADDAQIERALAVAERAAAAWRTTTFARRAAVLERAAELLRRDRDRYADLMALEMGKPLAEGRAEIEKCAEGCAFYAAHAEAMLAPARAAGPGLDATVRYRPLGAILAIMPWNFPFWQVFRFAAPAIMAGNVALLKHAPNVSGCAAAIRDLLAESGLPEGGLASLLIDEAQVPGLLADPRVAAVTLTGSERAGAAVAALAGAHLKKSVLELGGSDPFIVCADADLPAAVAAAVASRFQNAGQSCIAAKRFLVDARVRDAFLEAFVAAVRALVVGDPKDPRTQVGPLARRDLRDALARQVDASVALGAKALCGGRVVPGAGYFYEPTVLVDVPREAPALREELFGPVAPVVAVADVEEALAIAVDTPYGLGATIWSRDVERAERLAARLEAGSVAINGVVRSDARLPFGGVKRSGYGRELGAFGLLEFMNVQAVRIG